MKISIITRVFNNTQITKECIESVRNNTPGIDYEHIIIDNGSTDGTLEYLKSLQNIILIDNGRNLGCAMALNQGVARASGKYICNIDNDVIVSKNWLPPMLELAEKRQDIGIVSPGTREGRLDYDFDSYAENFKRRMKHVTAMEFGGWCMLIKREVFDKIGAFSEEFNMYCEDTDFYLRMKQMGYEAIRTGASFVHHRVNMTLSTIPEKKKIEHEHVLRLRDKWKIKEDGYFARKAKSLTGFFSRSYFRIFYGHLIVEKPWLEERKREERKKKHKS
jgi:GT2 family glycosyltransferase